MAEYTITVRGVEPQDRSFERVRHGLKAEMLELDDYGDVASVSFEGDMATVRMAGATDEVAPLMEGRVYYHLDHEPK